MGLGTKPGLLSVRTAASPGKKRSKSESKSRSRYYVCLLFETSSGKNR